MAEVSVSIGRGRELTAMQRSLWASQAKSPSSPHQNTALLWHIEAELDLDRLGIAFAAVVSASDALRTTIVSEAGRTMAVLTKATAVTEQLVMSYDDAQVWAASRAAITMDSTVSLLDSVAIDHQDGTVSWFLNLHHSITDATSSASVFAATASAYDGQDLDIDSYYEWADAQANDERTVAASNFWDSQPISPKVGRLYGPAGPSSASADRVEVGIQSLRADLDALLGGQLASLSKDLAWTSFLLTTTAVLIHRTSGADSFSIGLPLHNRAGAEAQAIIGPAMEVFPVAIEIHEDDTFLSLHKRVSRSAITTIRKAKPGSAPNQVSFESVVNVIPRGGVTNFGAFRATTTWVHPGAIDPSHLIRVQLTTYAGGPPRIELDINHAVGTDDERGQVAGHFNSVLAEFVSNPEAGIGSFPLLDLGEIETVTSWGTGRVHGTQVPDDVVSRLQASLMSNTGVALTDGDRKLTGPEVWAQVSSVARWLISSGVVSGGRVGIEMERTVDAVIAIYAVLAAGGSYVPLDPSQPVSRRKQLIDRAGCELVLTALPTLSEVDDAVELGAIGLQNEAYLLFTSGSTGEPKGVPITHLALADYLEYARTAYLVNDQPPYAALFTPLTFDLTVTSLFMPILAGGRLLTVAPNGLEGLIKVARSQDLTWLKATPSHLELLLRLVEPGHQLESLVVGGEAFTARLARQLWAAFDDVALFNEYGPTEAVVGCMYYKATKQELGALADVPIGKPAPGITLAVVDKYLQPVPVGAVGELLIASRGLTGGYLVSSDGSDPGQGKFVELDDCRYYRSGDLVRLVDSGTLVYHGRADSQIKVGGIRLEPTEVEAELEAHPAIRRAAARIWTPTQVEIVHHCVRCGLASNVPDAAFDDDGVCSVCHEYDRIAPQASDYFGETTDLIRMLAKAQADRTGDYDCIHLLSGGKDSTFALYQLVELGFKVFALTFDNGFISEGAKENARASAADLGVDHEFMSSEVMNEIFADSLARHSNVCHGCYKTIYTLATTKAEEIGAPIIFTGLSRGQLFETRLIPAQFTQDRFDPAAIDAAVVQARRVYHRVDDGPNRLLDNSVFADGTVFDRVSYVDYYRYTDVSLADMLEFLDKRAPWVRPSDTGRSTNCLVNAAGIHTHITEQGYHNYAEPYAWDVRLGHKTRDEAIEELDDQLDLDDVASMLAEIGYSPKPQEVFTGWIELVDGADEPTPGALRAFLADRLPKHAIPAAFVTMDELPTSANGKLADAQLPRPVRIHRAVPVVRLETMTETERVVTKVWEQVLNTEPVGIDDDFFALGGDSLAALEMVVALSDAVDHAIPEEIVFSHTTPRGLAAAIASVVQEGAADDAEIEEKFDDSASSEVGPLTPWQQSFVFEHLNDPDSGRQNVGRRYIVRGTVDVGRLAAAVQSAVERHLPLRTTLSLDDRRLLLASAAVDISAGFSPVGPDQLDEIANATLNRPFEIDNGPLMRVAIHPLTDGSTGVVLVTHHGVSDLAGLELIWTDVDKSYRGVQLTSLADAYRQHAMRHLAAVAAADTGWISSDQTEATKLNLALNVHGPDGYVHMPATFAAHTLSTVSGVTPMAAVLAGLVASLRPLSRSDTMTVALSVSAREQSASELAGCWLNVVPIQIEAGYGCTYRDLADQSGRAVGQALSRRMVPPATVNRIRRSKGLAPVNPQVMFGFSKLPHSELGGLQADHEVLSAAEVRAPIAFFAEVRGESVRLGLEYSGAVLDETEARKMLKGFEQSVAELIRSPHAVAVGATQSAAHLSAEAKNPSSDFEPLGTIISRFAIATPDALAIADGTRRINYAGLAEQARSVAQQLAIAGIGIGDKVGVFAPRSAQTVVGIVGVLTAGAAYVSLDPDYPMSRLKFIAGDGDLRAVVAAGEDAAVAGELGLPVIISDQVASEHFASEHFAEVEVPTLTASDPAYLIYTSGSTGQPKGVVVSHGSIMQSTSARTLVYGSDPEAFLLLSSFSFDSSLVGLFWTLTTGGALVLPEHGLHTDVMHLASVIAEMKISHLLAVPALYRVLLEETDAAKLDVLKTVIVAGEACSAELVVRHLADLGSVELHNEYGPTETTVWSHHYRFESDFGVDRVVPIGTAIPGVVSAVVDETGRPVTVGEVGELLIGGFGVTDGYQNRPVETAYRFVSASDYDLVGLDGTLYRTGDLVKVGADGLLSFVGRVDRQVKVRGFRVEPELVEVELISIEGVTDASVDTQEGRLVAWVATANAADHAESDRIKAALVGRVPSHEIPAVIVALEVLPRTVNGKIDRGALPAASASLATSESVGESTDPRANKIAQIWADVLGLDTVGLSDNFFDLGGDSILNIRIVARMRQAGLEVRPRDVFNNPTVAALTELVGGISHSKVALETVPMAGLVPLLEMQRWFFNQKFENPNYWTQSLWAGLCDGADLGLLESAAQELVNHHDILRSRFLRSGGSWTQFVADAAPKVEFIMFNAGTDRAVAAERVESTLDIETGRLVAVGVIKAPGATSVFLAIHHLVIDGVSWAPLLDDWTQAYEQLRDGQAVDLGRKGASQADWARAISGHQMHRHWPAISSHNDDRHLVAETLNAHIAVGPEDFAQISTDQLEASLVTAVGLAWCEVEALSRLEITLESHGRDQELAPQLDLTRSLGWFTSQYPVAVDFGASPSPSSALAAVAQAINAVESLGVGFDSGDPESKIPGFAFNYLGQLDRSIPTGTLFTSVGNFTAGIGQMNHRPHSVGVVAWISDGKLIINWDGAEAEMSQEKLDRLTHLTVSNLSALNAAPSAPTDIATTGVDATTMAALGDLLGGLDS